MDEREQNTISECSLHFSSNDDDQKLQILLSVQTRSSGTFKFKINGDALYFLQRQILGVQDIDETVQALNNQADIYYFCAFNNISGVFTIFNSKYQYPIRYSKRLCETKQSDLVPKIIQIEFVCLRIVQIIMNLKKEQFYDQSTASIKERLLQMLQATPNITSFSKQRLRAYFQKTSTKEKKKPYKEMISPTPRIIQGLSESKQYIFHPTFVTVDIFYWIMKDSPYNYLILGRSGMGKSSSCIFYSELTYRLEQILLQKKQNQLRKLVSSQMLKIPKIVYLSFRKQDFDYYQEIVNQLPKKGPNGKLEWTKSASIFKQIKNFYKLHKIAFKLVLDQVNIYSSLVREQESCKTRNTSFIYKRTLDVMQEIIEYSKRLSVLYCSSNNIERNYFIGSKYTSNRAKVHTGSDDITVFEVRIGYEHYQNAYRGFVEAINAIRFQLRLRCDQKEKADQIDQLIQNKLSSINKNQFEITENYHSENILTFHVINTLFATELQTILKFIEENKQSKEFLHLLLKYFKAQSLRKQVDKYSQFLRKGSQLQRYERLMLFEKLACKARQIVKTQKKAESKFSFSLILSTQKTQNHFADLTNMENTLIEKDSKDDWVKLTVFYPPETFLYISRNIEREEEAYIKIVKEALNAIGGLNCKFDEVIDSIYSKLLSQEDSILTIGDQLFRITGQRLSFVHFSSNSLQKKEDIQNYDIMRHFRKIIRALQQNPKQNDTYFGAYPVLMPLSISGEWQETEQSKHTNCSWCIDSLLVNKHEKQQGKYNIISLDFTAGNSLQDTFQKYHKSFSFFNRLHEVNAGQFEKFNIVHKIVVQFLKIHFCFWGLKKQHSTQDVPTYKIKAGRNSSCLRQKLIAQ